jgi:protein gp37
MSDKTSIEWTDATWNPVTGCTKVSPGCDNCYAETFSERFRGTPGHYFEGGFDLQLRPDKLDQPLRWKKPRRIFVNSMSDLFHKDVPDEYILGVFGVMAEARQHTFQLLTKRHARMQSLLSRWAREVPWLANPLPNVWLGVSTEDQKWADIRIPALLETPAAVRFISAEPLLGPINLQSVGAMPFWCLGHGRPAAECPNDLHLARQGIDWVIVGGESGRNARPMHPDWARTLRDQCVDSDVSFLFKQWGEWSHVDRRNAREGDVWVIGEGMQSVPWRPDTEGAEAHRWGPHRDETMRRVGKRAAGRELDGHTWDQYPTDRIT